jgi:hypothetical protein
MLGAGEKPSGFDAVIRGFSAVAVDSSGRIVCAARLAGNSGTVPSDIAIVTVDEAGPKVVARVGTRPPGFPSGVEWSSFPSLALSQNAAGPVFVGKLRASTVGTHKRSNATIAQTIGLWATDSAGVPQLIVRTGDMFDARRKIRTFSALDAVKGSPTQTRSINTQGELIYRAGLSDGSEALVTVRLP